MPDTRTPSRSTPGRWTPEREAAFLAALARGLDVRAACREVGISRDTAYAHRRRDPDLAARWDGALAGSGPLSGLRCSTCGGAADWAPELKVGLCRDCGEETGCPGCGALVLGRTDELETFECEACGTLVAALELEEA